MAMKEEIREIKMKLERYNNLENRITELSARIEKGKEESDKKVKMIMVAIGVLFLMMIIMIRK